MIVDEKLLSRWAQVVLVTTAICVTMQALFPNNRTAQMAVGVVVALAAGLLLRMVWDTWAWLASRKAGKR